MYIKVVYYIFFLTVFFMLASPSCESDPYINEEARLKTEQEYTLMKIKSQFEAEYLSEEHLSAYGEKAKQKIYDFADYLCLYSDKNTVTVFKVQVKEMNFFPQSRSKP